MASATPGCLWRCRSVAGLSRTRWVCKSVTRWNDRLAHDHGGPRWGKTGRAVPAAGPRRQVRRPPVAPRTRTQPDDFVVWRMDVVGPTKKILRERRVACAPRDDALLVAGGFILGGSAGAGRWQLTRK